MTNASNRIQLPAEWWQYHNKSAFFFTYFGEIYFGSIWELMDYPDRFFIVQNDKIRTISNLKTEERTLAKYQELGREILDVNVIKHVEDESFGATVSPMGRTTYSTQRFKKLFVFGAGASANCVFGDDINNLKKSDLCPPHSYEIFSQKYEPFIEQCPAAKISIPHFSSQGMNIETCFEEEWNIFKSYYNPRLACQHINIQFFLQKLFQNISEEVIKRYWRGNLYSLMLDKLQKYIGRNSEEKVSIVSFNYDTILEDFASQIFGYKYETLDDYTNWNKRNLLIFKPHGSHNWGWKFRKDRIEGNSQSTIASYLYQHKIEPYFIYFNLIDDIDRTVARNAWGIELFNDEHYRGKFTINKNLMEVIPENSDEAYLPALLLPYREKDEMLMPYHQAFDLKNLMPKIEEIYLIGWQGNEDMFNKLLREAHHLKKIIIANPNSKGVQNNLTRYIDLKKYEVIEIKDFETFVRKDLDSFLA